MGKKKFDWSLLMGAAFLMATSSIGPGFLTQTTVFTQQLMASFGFVILFSVILDVGAQLNVWRIIGVSGKRGQDIANDVFPGLGYFVAFLIVLGGLAFNIGNIAGCGLGFQVLFGLDPKIGAIVSAVIGISIFVVKEAGKAMDKFTQIAGFAMILLTLYVAISSNPPVGEAIQKTFMPDTIDYMSIVTLIGGTVGGYITFSGGHRLVDAGVVGKEALPQITRSSVTGVCVTGVMRVLLFLATLGVVAAGFTLDKSNPPASVFLFAAGNVGFKIFGVVMWAAAISSVIGAAYTSVSFIRTFSQKLDTNYRWLVIAFIVFSTFIFVVVGRPVFVLVIVGTLNGLILPITLGVMLLAAYNKKIVGDYKHPIWMTAFGAIVVVMTAYMSIMTLITQVPKWLG
jgi:Mn2+/Fe2+ NRAMP family transporter